MTDLCAALCAAAALLVLALPDLVSDSVLGIVGNLASAVVGTFFGWWLAQRSSAARARAEARAAARQSLARLYVLLWPPTRYAELTAGLDSIDADLVVAGVSPQLRAALALVATESWTDGAVSAGEGHPEPGISTKLLLAYRVVRSAILRELAQGRGRRSARRAAAAVDRVDQLVAENRADRRRRLRAGGAASGSLAPPVRTIDVDKGSGSR